jgi:Tol biopolymer transport system component
LYLVDPETAIPRRIPIKGHAAAVPSWSRDGKWIYFSAEDRLYRVSPQGGDPTLVTKTMGYNVQESKDGRFLYFISGNFAGNYNGEIRVKDGIAGEERPIAGMPKGVFPTEWVLTPSGIYFVDRRSRIANIAFFDFAMAKVTRSIPVEKNVMTWGRLAMSPDGKWLVYSQIDEVGTT